MNTTQDFLIGTYLKSQREKLNIKQKYICELIEMSDRQYRRIENNEIDIQDMRMLNKICDILRINDNMMFYIACQIVRNNDSIGEFVASTFRRKITDGKYFFEKRNRHAESSR